MKAVVCEKYGPPNVAKLKEVQNPSPLSNQVLIQIVASTVNRTDTGFRSAMYFISRFWSGLLKPKYPIWGNEFAGVIVSIGNNVSKFKIGDRVFGYNDKTFGAHAEFICAFENDAIALIPSKFNFYDAAPLTEGAHYALNNIKAAKVTKNQHVMVYGATGAIGSAAVQLLKALGAHVTAVCNTKNVDLMKSLGADVVLDYQTQDYTLTDMKFDFFFDAVGKSAFKIARHLLKPKGIYISTELGKRSINVFLALFTPLFGGKRVLFPIPTMSHEDAEYIAKLAENGQFKPVIDSFYDMEQIVEAYAYVESGQKTGNVILKISNPLE